MRFSTIIVDDETPSLRFVQAIIEKYVPELAVADTAASGVEALERMDRQPVDLVLTDISMPGMNGIALAERTRELYPATRIVFISGYADFEYAMGAIRVTADDYLLKPLNISNTTQSLKKVARKLADEYTERWNNAVCGMAVGADADSRDALLSKPCRFALIRWGNAPFGQPAKIHNTRVIASPGFPYTVIQGADENERVIIMDQPPRPFEEFQADCEEYARGVNPQAYTAALSRAMAPLSALGGFIEKARLRVEKRAMIGKPLVFRVQDHDPEPPPLPNASNALRQAEYFASSGNMDKVKDIFINMAAEWENGRNTQRQVSKAVLPMAQRLSLSRPSKRGDTVLRDTMELIQQASSCGELMAGLFDLLYRDEEYHGISATPQKLCEYAMTYIRENYTKPLSVQAVCSEIGVSHTYLNRLLRKYGGTSFSAYLTQCRMDAAIELIRRQPETLLRDVAACVGYDDPSYFSKVFHQAVGCAPTQFAADAREGTRDGYS
jgi:two-component system response regulator YesN